MITQVLGYPRIGAKRELKKACEAYWAGNITEDELFEVGQTIKKSNWEIQQQQAINWIPSNDFSFYDQVLDLSLTVGAIPKRYQVLIDNRVSKTDLYFAMARGYQKNGHDIIAMEMTKWLDTNYHYIVPEFTKNQEFHLFSSKIIDEFLEAKEQGIITKPVLIGPVTYLWLGKEKEEGFNRIDLLKKLLPVYLNILTVLQEAGAKNIQFDEPILGLDITKKEKAALQETYACFAAHFPQLNIILTTYFEGLEDNLELAKQLPVNVLHVDLVRAPKQLDAILNDFPSDKKLSLGVVDGRNIWKNDFSKSLNFISTAKAKVGAENIIIAPSCSLLHVPFDLDQEDDEQTLPQELKNWLAFAKQKVQEVATLAKLAAENPSEEIIQAFEKNKIAIESRKTSTKIHQPAVKNRVLAITNADAERENPFAIRQQKQEKALHLPLFPTTTIGSFPQTPEVRRLRFQFKKENISKEVYENQLKVDISDAIKWQEEIGLDVLVHGEFERNDMVEYFGEQLNGFAFTKYGWVQSYGSRGVKPPIIFGDVSRPKPMTVAWTALAQSFTKKEVKGMLTGPITILQWSFVRDDQPRKTTAEQIALAIRDEVEDLEKAGINIIQIDEPAIREGLPLRKNDWQTYLDWAVNAFKLSAAVAKDETQIHTHMCYSEFNEIIESIAAMDADVITIETSRSQMELLEVFSDFKYPNEIGPGVYDIHSPRVPSEKEMEILIDKAVALLSPRQLWVNPDCGLKTRKWEETKAALLAMVNAAKKARKKYTTVEA
ncbi:5-methyltetrahydropteroyltriglutamate--homocysteine S-methyltransferase [Zhouia sp. PK063]|uniref:5-methyltetrahydropteroyltriglutamate-- homocysteine S-methyltransferase n=1 Tax=Zhouia sp. PK063 TaxID=3373602 RepID=UPI0037B747AF